MTSQIEDINKKMVYVYIVSMGGGIPKIRILFVMTLEDAQKLCNSNKTSGVGWMLMYTDKERFDNNPDCNNPKWQKDDGRFDEIINRLNIVVIEKV